MNYLTLRLGSLLKRSHPFTRFLLVGVINTLMGLSIMFTCFHIFGWTYWISTFIGNSMGAVVSYLLNRKFTFSSNVTLKKGLPKFIFVILFCYFLAFSTSEWFCNWMTFLNWQTFMSQEEQSILVGSFLYTLLNYGGQKYFVFGVLKTRLS
ncbi:GtrA family protein [Neobacillus sp. D3-1R]|uniref:GtrA family protein n=1 Tax=Neobacillus sp. D3-1R TaxID=3445778 RepID=UPI003FA07B17